MSKAKKARGNREGSIYRRSSDGRWVSSIVQGNGRRKYIYGRTREDVAKKLVKALSNVQSGLPATELRSGKRASTYL